MFKLVMLCCCLAVGTFAVADIRDPNTAESFPTEVSFDHDGKMFNLQATGVATRKKFFVSVYSVAHYLQEGAELSGNKFLALLNDDEAKQLTLKWVRAVEADKVREGYEESFKKGLTASEHAKLQREIAQFVGYFQHEVKKGDEHILRWLPGGYVEVIIGGNVVGSLTNPSFAKALWAIWFGDKSVVDREKLISLLK